MLRQSHPRQQGDLGEAAAIEWLTRQGAGVWIPLFHSPDVDLVAEVGDALIRIQVKTATYFRHGRYEVRLSTSGGNQSWNGTVKHFSPTRCDYLFALVEGGRRWFIPADTVGGATAIRLGGPKYEAYEVDSSPGAQLALASPSLDSPAPRRDTEAVKRVAL